MIDGTYNILYIKWDENFLPIGCLTSDSFDENIDMLETTTRDNEGWKTSVPTNQGYNISFDGLIENTYFNGGDCTKISLDRLRVLKRNRTLIEWRIQTQDENLVFVDSGYGYITSLSKNANIDEFISFSSTIEGYGKPTNTTEQLFNQENMIHITFNTYAEMLAYGTPTCVLKIRIINDENKGIENSTYIWYSDNTRLWVASTSDN